MTAILVHRTWDEEKSSPEDRIFQRIWLAERVDDEQRKLELTASHSRHSRRYSVGVRLSTRTFMTSQDGQREWVGTRSVIGIAGTGDFYLDLVAESVARYSRARLIELFELRSHHLLTGAFDSKLDDESLDILGYAT